MRRKERPANPSIHHNGLEGEICLIFVASDVMLSGRDVAQRRQGLVRRVCSETFKAFTPSDLDQLVPLGEDQYDPGAELRIEYVEKPVPKWPVIEAGSD